MQSVDSRYGLPISPEMTGNFFRGMSLGDFYGKDRPNPREIPITDEQFFRWHSTAPNDEERRIRYDEQLAFARQHGIEELGGGRSHRDTGSFLNERVTYQHITEWLPSHEEREFILRLAQSVAGEGKKPVILDAACGSGAVAKILASDGMAQTVGVDLLLEEMGANKLPAIKGAVLKHADLWDVIDDYSPQFPDNLQKEREDLLKRLRERIQDNPVFKHISIFSASAQFGDPDAMNEEVARLQEISQMRTSESPVDLVICSFMPSTADMTIPIREGINPKAIVYIRPTSGMSGAGDYYINEAEANYEGSDGMEFTFKDGEDDLEPVIVNPNSVISYNPGVNYRTAARWLTPWENNWMRGYNKFGYLFDAEGAVQLRNDVRPRRNEVPHIEKYGLDIQFANALGDRKSKFQEGVSAVNRELFS